MGSKTRGSIYLLPFLSLQLIGKDPNAGKDRRQRRRWQQRMRCLDGITDSMDMNLSKLQETVKDREAWRVAGQGSQGVRQDLVIKQKQVFWIKDGGSNSFPFPALPFSLCKSYRLRRKVEVGRKNKQ